MTSEKSYTGWYFLVGVLITYLILSFFNLSLVFSALKFAQNIFLHVLPILLLIFVLMALTNYFLQTKTLTKYLDKNSGIKGWIIAIVGGILSAGPIYMWYPLLSNLKKHGMRDSLIATFLYNRAVKIPLLPLLIVYFGLTYSVVLMVVMILMSIIQGHLTETLMEIKNV